MVIRVRRVRRISRFSYLAIRLFEVEPPFARPAERILDALDHRRRPLFPHERRQLRDMRALHQVELLQTDGFEHGDVEEAHVRAELNALEIAVPKCADRLDLSGVVV
jgi:hypothetical protein